MNTQQISHLQSREVLLHCVIICLYIKIENEKISQDISIENICAEHATVAKNEKKNPTPIHTLMKNCEYKN